MLLVYRVLVDAVLPNGGYMKNSSNHDGNHVAPRFTVLLNQKELCRFYLGGAEQRGETVKWTGSIGDANIFLEASCWDPSAQMLAADQLFSFMLFFFFLISTSFRM